MAKTHDQLIREEATEVVTYLERYGEARDSGLSTHFTSILAGAARIIRSEVIERPTSDIVVTLKVDTTDAEAKIKTMADGFAEWFEIQRAKSKTLLEEENLAGAKELLIHAQCISEKVSRVTYDTAECLFNAHMAEHAPKSGYTFQNLDTKTRIIWYAKVI